MSGVIYFTRIGEKYQRKNLDHMIGEKLLETALRDRYGLELSAEPRVKGSHGKPFLTRQPEIHYNISHSGKYVVCFLADQEVGIDVQEHKKVNYERMLERMVPQDMIREILDSDDPEQAFYTQWVLREAYVKWTGEGMSKDFRTIYMTQGCYMLLDLEPGYSCACWSAGEMELCMQNVEIELPDVLS